MREREIRKRRRGQHNTFGRSIFYSFIHSFINHSIHSSFHSYTRTHIHSSSHSVVPSCVHAIIPTFHACTCIPSVTQSLAHSFTRSLIHSLSNERRTQRQRQPRRVSIGPVVVTTTTGVEEWSQRSECPRRQVPRPQSVSRHRHRDDDDESRGCDGEYFPGSS
eukprot:GHVU01025170.1.p1 GENE.GHVU01025170.1~~GHVU01025170.1.p1  ORF type:complete len:163 (-),score=2.18 GHVU01025170.1:2763-3251(-)